MAAAAPARERVVVYSTAERRYCTPLIEGFARRHPGVALEIVDGISLALDRRFRAEIAAGEPSADVVWSSAMDLQAVLVREGHAARIAPDAARDLPQDAVYRECAFATTREPLVTLVDASALGNEPAGSLGEIAALLAREPERFRGRVCIYDLATNGLGLLAMLHESRLREGFAEFVATLRRCAPRVHPWNPPIVDDLASGRALLAPHVLGAYAARAVIAHPQLRVAASRYPAIAVSRVALVSRHAPNPPAARAFVDYLLSQDGQADLDAAGLFALRPAANGDAKRGVAALPRAPIALDASFDALLDPARRRELLSLWPAAAVPAQ